MSRGATEVARRRTGREARGRRTRGRVVALTMAAWLGGCGGGDPDAGAGPVVRDSAGVAVVENPDIGPTPPAAWHPVPTTVVASVEGRPETHFGFVADVTVRADTLFVLDQHAREVRVFGPRGDLLRTVGRPGEGPGELSRFATTLLLVADTLLVADWARGRMHRFRTDGTFLDAPALPSPGARSWWRVGPDGHFWVRSLTRVTDEAGRWGGMDVLLRLAHVSAVPDTVMIFRYPETDLGARGAPRLPLVVNAPAWDVLADGRVAWVALSDRRLRIHRPDGSLERIVAAPAWGAAAPGLDDRARLVELMREKMVMLGGSPDAVDQLEVDLPAHLPALTDVRAGPDGTVWVQRRGSLDHVHPMALNTPDPPSGWGGPNWDVLDASGRTLGGVTLDPGTRVMRVLADRVVGVRRDALDRDEVVVWRLVGPPTPGP